MYSVVAFLVAEFYHIVSGIVVVLVVLVLRKGIYYRARVFHLWILNREVKISRLVIYSGSSDATDDQIKSFIDDLKSEKNNFSVDQVQSSIEEYIISKHSYTIRLRITDQLIDSPDFEHAGIRIVAKMNDLLLPYRTGLSALEEILPALKSSIDRSFGKDTTDFRIKIVIPHKLRQKHPETTIFHESKMANGVVGSDSISVTETDIHKAMTKLKKVLSRAKGFSVTS